MEKAGLKALVLAGGCDQIALIKELKAKKYEILLADYLDDPPAKKEADHFFQISTLDETGIYNLAKRENVNIVITACTDQALLTAANVSEKLRLPFYLSGKIAQNVTNKFDMKRKFKENHIPSADYRVLEHALEEETEALDFCDFPYVVKPCDCNSSKGVQKVENLQELKQAINKAFSLSRSKRVIVERFLDGVEISADIWIQNSIPQILSVTQTKKMGSHSDLFTIYQSCYPVQMTLEIEKQINEISYKLCEAFGLKNGPMLVQAIIKENKVYVLEFSPRIGGGSKYKFIEYMTGVNIMRLYTDFVVDSPEVKAMPMMSEKLYEMDYIYAYNGTFKTLKGYEELKQHNVICEYFQYKKEGAEIHQRNVSGDRIAGVLIEADTMEELKNKRDTLLHQTEILDMEGNDITYRECFNVRRRK